MDVRMEHRKDKKNGEEREKEKNGKKITTQDV
jgi:hypothetical protein